jgi:transposase InsO family protein
MAVGYKNSIGPFPGRGSITAMLASLLYLVLLRLLTLVAPSYRSDDAAQIEILVLRHQLAILRRQVKRPIYPCCDRALLAAASRILPRERWGAFLVRPETLLRWHRSLVARKWTRPHRRPGRPAIDPKVCKLILQMARENPRWRYVRIKGELGKLGVRSSATSIAMLLRRSGLGPAPRRGLSWRGFLKAQAAGILACDFFTVETAFLKTLYVLFFIEIGTRRVHVTVSTTNPDSSFVTQQARNLAMSLADEGTQIRFLIRDRDAKFCRSFDDVFASEGIRVIRTPIRAPNANAFAERWIETLRAECLDWLLILGSRHLDRVLRIYVRHYNRRRPHRGLELGVPESIGPIEEADGVPAIERRDVLGGLLHEYMRAA